MQSQEYIHKDLDLNTLAVDQTAKARFQVLKDFLIVPSYCLIDKGRTNPLEENLTGFHDEDFHNQTFRAFYLH